MMKVTAIPLNISDEPCELPESIIPEYLSNFGDAQ